MPVFGSKEAIGAKGFEERIPVEKRSRLKSRQANPFNHKKREPPQQRSVPSFLFFNEWFRHGLRQTWLRPRSG